MRGELAVTEKAVEAERAAAQDRLDAIQNDMSPEAAEERKILEARILELEVIKGKMADINRRIIAIEDELNAGGVSETRANGLLQERRELEVQMRDLQAQARVNGEEVARISAHTPENSPNAALIIEANGKLAVIAMDGSQFVEASIRINDFFVKNLTIIFTTRESQTDAANELLASYSRLKEINASVTATVKDLESLPSWVLSGTVALPDRQDIDSKTINEILGRCKVIRSTAALNESINTCLKKIEALDLAVNPALMATLVALSGPGEGSSPGDDSYGFLSAEVARLKSTLSHLDFIIRLLDASKVNEMIADILQTIRKEIEQLVQKGVEKSKELEGVIARGKERSLREEIVVLRQEISNLKYEIYIIANRQSSGSAEAYISPDGSERDAVMGRLARADQETRIHRAKLRTS